MTQQTSTSEWMKARGFTAPDTSPAKRIDRTDPHCPKNLIPEDYEYVGQECMKIEGLGDCYYIQEQRRLIQEHMTRTGGTYSKHEHGGNCGVCGSVNAVYTILFYHQKSNSYVRMGQECAMLVDAGCVPHFNQLRKSVADAREFQKGKQKAQALLSDAGITAAWDIYQAGRPKALADLWEEMQSLQDDSNEGRQISRELRVAELADKDAATIRSIVEKLVRYGSISEKQVAFIKTLLARIADRPAYEAKRQAENDAAAPCPTGRVEVEGEIVSLRVDETPYGTVTKMLLKAKEGFKVWGTIPSSSAAKKGDTIKIKATITPSPTDPKFGFAKRPQLISEILKEVA